MTKHSLCGIINIRGDVMSKRLMKNSLINKSEIKEELVKIECSKNAYIARSGKVFLDYGNNNMFPLKTFVNKHNGYLYVGFDGTEGKRIQRRVHVLVAKAFIPNPKGLPIVCHKDNNKANPCSDNLEWGTVSYNTKKAFDDGLARNDRGWEDSQSKPVVAYTLEGLLFKTFGSVGEASKELGITKTAILFQCNNLTKKKPRKGYYFRFYNEYNKQFLVL